MQLAYQSQQMLIRIALWMLGPAPWKRPAHLDDGVFTDETDGINEQDIYWPWPTTLN